MAVLVNAEMEEVDIRPTHRLLRDVSADWPGGIRQQPGSGLSGGTDGG